MPRNLDELFEALSKSKFRSRFDLRERELQYLREKGFETVMRHASDLIAQRLAPADIPNDGRQTPWRGHPVFVAQHATACCCRGCLEKWHGIAKGKALDEREMEYVLSVIRTWLERRISSCSGELARLVPGEQAHRYTDTWRASEVQGELFDPSDR